MNKIKELIVVNAFVCDENILHVQWQEKGGLFYNQEKVFLGGNVND